VSGQSATGCECERLLTATIGQAASDEAGLSPLYVAANSLLEPVPDPLNFLARDQFPQPRWVYTGGNFQRNHLPVLFHVWGKVYVVR
jgi:hypothetical protein